MKYNLELTADLIRERKSRTIKPESEGTGEHMIARECRRSENGHKLQGPEQGFARDCHILSEAF